MPALVIRPMTPDTRARCCSGIRSGISEVSADSAALMPNWAMAQPRAISGMLSAAPTTASPSSPRTVPASSQGRRLPNRLVVRSDKAPKSGLAISARTAPTAMISPRLTFLVRGATASTRSDMVTTTGVRIAM